MLIRGSKTTTLVRAIKLRKDSHGVLASAPGS